MKHTKQKELILNAVNTLQIHPTADEIYSMLKKDNERLSLGTVYRNLNSFAEQGKIRKVSVPGLGDRFDFRLDAHEHIYCRQCGRVYDVDMEIPLDQLVPEDVTVTGYQLMLYGTCIHCAHTDEQ